MTGVASEAYLVIGGGKNVTETVTILKNLLFKAFAGNRLRCVLQKL